jgi:hypothetical protein
MPPPITILGYVGSIYLIIVHPLFITMLTTAKERAVFTTPSSGVQVIGPAANCLVTILLFAGWGQAFFLPVGIAIKVWLGAYYFLALDHTLVSFILASGAFMTYELFLLLLLIGLLQLRERVNIKLVVKITLIGSWLLQISAVIGVSEAVLFPYHDLQWLLVSVFLRTLSCCLPLALPFFIERHYRVVETSGVSRSSRGNKQMRVSADESSETTILSEIDLPLYLVWQNVYVYGSRLPFATLYLATEHQTWLRDDTYFSIVSGAGFIPELALLCASYLVYRCWRTTASLKRSDLEETLLEQSLA